MLKVEQSVSHTNNVLFGDEGDEDGGSKMSFLCAAPAFDDFVHFSIGGLVDSDDINLAIA